MMKKNKQKGMTLIIAMMLLVVLVLLGTTVAVNNGLQVKMASGTRQRDLAFQAAEHALKAAEVAINSATSLENIYIQNIISSDPSSPTATKPDYLSLNGESHANDAKYWKETFDWTLTSSNPVTGIGSDLVNANPRYLIERLPNASCPDEASKTCFYFRATAHGVGKNANAEVVLQAMYKFKK